MKSKDAGKKIAEAFSNVDFGNYSQVADAAEELKGVNPEEVLSWISDKLKTEWHWDEVISNDGVQNIERVFGTQFDIEVLINAYFKDDEHWYFGGKEDQWIDEFNEFTDKEITVNDVIECIDVDYLLASQCSYGPGLCVFFDFIEANYGDFKLFIRRLAPEIDKLSHEDVEDVVYCLDEYLEDGDLDMKKLFSRIEWSSVYKQEVRDYAEFFRRHAPELLSKIPLTAAV